MRDRYDLAIVGSGFGGSLMAMAARRLGLTAVLLERETHPRFAIGESTSPLANLILEQFAARYDLPRLLPLTTYGAWQRAYPEIVCGLKRGFTYFAQTAGEEYGMDADRNNQLLVAASPCDSLADTHWLRSDVDQFLVNEAISIGVDYHDRADLAPPRWENGTATLTGERLGVPFALHAHFIIDATGPRGFLSRALEMKEAVFAAYPKTQSLYTHFIGVKRCDGLASYATAGTPPYPMDDAALHHIFDGGWLWVLRFGSGVTSAGVTVTDALASELRLCEGRPAWHRLLNRFPTLQAQFAEAVPIRPITYAPRLAYRTSAATGPGWAMLPSAAAFIDPLFSTGIPLTLLGVERLCRILEEDWGTERLGERMQEYGEITLAEADATADYIGACYAALGCFPVFSALSMFYFAAASYSEMARRLDRPHLVRRFVAADHPQFGPSLRRTTAWVRDHAPGFTTGEITQFTADVREAVACLNVAGLCNPAKQNWYGVDLEDVVTSAEKLSLTPEEMGQILSAAPWAQMPSGAA